MSFVLRMPDDNTSSRSNSPSPSESSEDDRPCVSTKKRPDLSRVFLSQQRGAPRGMNDRRLVTTSDTAVEKTSKAPRFPESNPFGSLPAFRPSFSLPKVFSPLLSPRSQPSGVQRGFFDSVHGEKSMSSPAVPNDNASSFHAPPNTPRVDEQLFRVSRSPEPMTDRVDYVSELPDHLPTSPLCPRNPKHKSKGRGSCPVHGGGPLSDGSGSEEERAFTKKSKNLENFL